MRLLNFSLLFPVIIDHFIFIEFSTPIALQNDDQTLFS